MYVLFLIQFVFLLRFQDQFGLVDVKSTIKQPKMFLNHFLKEGQGDNMPHNGARCLQFLCIQILFQLVSFSVFLNYDGLKEYIDDVYDKFSKTHQNQSVWAKVLPTFREMIFSFMFQPPVLLPSLAKAKFQIEFGYKMFLQQLLKIYGPGKHNTRVTSRNKSSAVQVKPRKTSVPKKRNTSDGDSVSLLPKPKKTRLSKKPKTIDGNSASLLTRLQQFQTEILLQVWTSQYNGTAFSKLFGL